ncbi:MAG: hypothetical protein J6Q89_04580, partial [Clostridia bacterium]|nr:hypothetical protein [Clostridia bacterium]
MQKAKRILSLLVAMLMLFCSMPMFSFANDNIDGGNTDVTYSIIVHNGDAYDINGNWRDSAKPGEEITLIPYDYIGGREFEGWEVWYGDLGENFNDTAEQTTFVMPAEDVEIEAYYPPAMLETLNFNLYGYFAGAPVDALYPEAPFGTDINYIDNYPYSLCENAYGDIGQVLHEDIIREGESYWLTLSIVRGVDVYFGKIMPENVTLTFDNGEVINATYAEFGSATTADIVVATFELPAAPVRDDLIDVAVNGGWALVNGCVVEQTVPGMPVEISSDNGPEGQIFKEWKINSGDIAIADVTNPFTVFIAGEEDVEIEAVFGPRGGISEIVIEEVDAPVEDEKCDFEVSVPEYAGYTVHEVNWKLLDGAASTENYVYLGPNYTYTNGRAYLVEVVVKADEGQYFECATETNPEITGYVNGEVANVTTFEDESGYEYLAIEYVYVLLEEEQKINVDNIELTLDNYYVGRSTDDITLTSDVAGVFFNGNYHGKFQISKQDALGNWIPVYTRKLSEQCVYRISISAFAAEGYTFENLEAENVTLNGFVCTDFNKYSDTNFSVEYMIIPPLNEEAYTVWGEVVYEGYDVWLTTQTNYTSDYEYNFFYVEVAEQSNPDKVVYKFRPNRDGSFKRYLHDGDYILKTTLKTTKTTDEFGKTTLKTTKTTLDLGKTTLIDGKTTLDIGKTTLDDGKTTLKTTLDGGKTTLDLGKTTLDEFVMVNLKTTLKTTQPSKTTSPEKTTLKLRRLGDANGDLNIDSVDYLIAKRICFKTVQANELSALAGDPNKDGLVDS